MNKKQIIGVVIFVVLIGFIVGVKYLTDNSGDNPLGLTTIYVATGGGKEDFLADPQVNKILKRKYKLNVVFDNWSNGKTVTQPLIREYVGLGDQTIANKMASGDTSFSIHSSGVSTYDALFTSDQRFYDYYKLWPNKEVGEADRYNVLGGSLTLNTPIVIYSWGSVVDALTNEGIVTNVDGVYYISDMNKLMSYILEGKKWNDIGVNVYGKINIASTDPVTSSPGATYYGLLLSVLSEGLVTDQNINDNLPKLKQFYIQSGYMNNTPADLFERYLKTGVGGQPMIVDYEKSIIDFANSNKEGFDKVKNDIRILYPSPTIWNSHCFAYFTEKGKKLYKAFDDKEIQQIAWEKYGFRTGITGGSYDVSSIGIGVPQTISSTVSSLKMDTYNSLIEYLKNGE